MAIRGDDPLKIMSRAGHVDFSTTQGYIREAEAVRAGFGDVFPPLPPSLLRADDGSGEPSRMREERTKNVQKNPGFRPNTRKHLKLLWRRRESNPGPQGVQLTFVHVRSRHIPGG
jgi:hypothetical protein